MPFVRKASAIFLILLGLVSKQSDAMEPSILRVSMEAEPISFDWNNPRSATDRFILSFLMRGLLKYDAAGKLVCDLCLKKSVSADGKTWSFDLDPSSEWSDDVKLEARHFADSFHRLLDPANRFESAEDFKIIGSVVAETKHRLRINLTKPMALFPHLLTTIPSFPIRKEFLKRKKPGEEHSMMAVLGPYQLAEWKRGVRIVLEGNDKYSRNPKTKRARPVYRVEFHLGKHDVQIERFKAGKLDIVSGPTTEDLLKVRGQKTQVNPYWATRSLIFNIQKLIPSELALRRTILYALDRDSLPAYLKNGERKTTGIIPPGLTGNRELPLATADSARATAERAQVSAGPKPFELELLIQDLDGDKKVAQWLFEQLEKVKIRLKTTAQRGTAYLLALNSGRFDVALVTWPFGIASPLELLQTFRTGSATNRGKWTNVAFDAVLDQLVAAQADRDPTTFASLVDGITQILEVEGVGVIPLGYPTQPFLLGRRVVNFATTPFGDPDLVKIQLK